AERQAGPPAAAAAQADLGRAEGRVAMRRPCYVVDAFAAHPLAGNSAGVLLDGADLDARAMQQIAGELKHSETAFPLPAREPTAAFHVLVEEAQRIRVPENGLTRSAFTCKSGRLNVELTRRAGKLRVLIEVPESRFEPVRVPAELLTALGFVPEALDPRIPPQKSTILEGNLYLAVRE